MNIPNPAVVHPHTTHLHHHPLALLAVVAGAGKSWSWDAAAVIDADAKASKLSIVLPIKRYLDDDPADGWLIVKIITCATTLKRV